MDWKEGVELLLPVREVVFGFWIFIPSKPANEVTNAMVFILISFPEFIAAILYSL